MTRPGHFFWVESIIMDRSKLIDYLDDFLQVSNYKDYAPNGLQVEGKPKIEKIVTGVTACQDLIDIAIEKSADAIMVHHGYFWKNESPTVTGIKQQRIKKLLEHDINLIAYHLPLDGHSLLGNNAMLAKLWELEDITEDDKSLVRLGKLQTPLKIEMFVKRVSKSLNRDPLHLPGGPANVKKIAWCSGGAQNYIQLAIDWQADVYISGEVSEQTTHIAKEAGIHYLAAGHHATERLGIQALGEHLANQFSLDVEFIDVKNPV